MHGGAWPREHTPRSIARLDTHIRPQLWDKMHETSRAKPTLTGPRYTPTRAQYVTTTDDLPDDGKGLHSRFAIVQTTDVWAAYCINFKPFINRVEEGSVHDMSPSTERHGRVY